MPQVEIRVSNKVFSLFEPDALLPIQYFETLRRRTPLEPEKRLMWAVLEDAIETYQNHFLCRQGKPNGDVDELEDWILDSDTRWLFSFHNICETLEINPQYLRRGLLTWKEKHLDANAEAKTGRAGASKRNPVVASLAVGVAR
jgi:hypothetical protein